jgi:hypothetical protein
MTASQFITIPEDGRQTMKNVSRASGFFGALILVIAAAACDEDPTSQSLGTASFIQPSFTVVNTAANTPFSLTATVRDAQLNQLGMQIEAASSNATLVRIDTTRFVPELNETRYVMRAGVTTRRDSATVTLSASGLTKAVKVIVTP